MTACNDCHYHKKVISFSYRHEKTEEAHYCLAYPMKKTAFDFLAGEMKSDFPHYNYCSTINKGYCAEFEPGVGEVEDTRDWPIRFLGWARKKIFSFRGAKE